MVDVWEQLILASPPHTTILKAAGKGVEEVLHMVHSKVGIYFKEIIHPLETPGGSFSYPDS